MKLKYFKIFLNNNKDIYKKIKKMEFTFPEDFPISIELKDLI